MSSSFFSRFSKNKRATEMSMQLVATIVLVLVGLVVVIYILVTKFRFFGDVDACEKRGYECKAECDEGLEYAAPYPCPKEPTDTKTDKCCAPRPTI